MLLPGVCCCQYGPQSMQPYTVCRPAPLLLLQLSVQLLPPSQFIAAVHLYLQLPDQEHQLQQQQRRQQHEKPLEQLLCSWASSVMLNCSVLLLLLVVVVVAAAAAAAVGLLAAPTCHGCQPPPFPVHHQKGTKATQRRPPALHQAAVPQTVNIEGVLHPAAAASVLPVRDCVSGYFAVMLHKARGIAQPCLPA